MEVRAALQYDEAIVRSAALAYARRLLFSAFGVALVVVGACFVSLVLSGDRSWIVGVLGTCVVLAVAVVVASFVVRWRDALGTLERMPSRTGQLVANDTHCSFSSELGSMTLAWADVREIWRYRDFWVLVLARRRMATLPLAALSADGRAFIVERVRAAGGRVGP